TARRQSSASRVGRMATWPPRSLCLKTVERHTASVPTGSKTVAWQTSYATTTAPYRGHVEPGIPVAASAPALNTKMDYDTASSATGMPTVSKRVRAHLSGIDSMAAGENGIGMASY